MFAIKEPGTTTKAIPSPFVRLMSDESRATNETKANEEWRQMPTRRRIDRIEPITRKATQCQRNAGKKPSARTIEVIDSTTGTKFKVACMACIRGHRTATCGCRLSCRSKVFWTLNRPGRPSNHCVCRFRASGICRCATVQDLCPHKAEEGKMRTEHCRCSELGRYCCTLDACHWAELGRSTTPTVELYRTLESLQEVAARSDSTSTSLAAESSSPGFAEWRHQSGNDQTVGGLDTLPRQDLLETELQRYIEQELADVRLSEMWSSPRVDQVTRR